MKPNEPHSFVPRSPDDSEGRTTCVCGLRADADPHLRAMLQRMVQQAATPLVLCSECGLRKCYRKGKCRACYRRETIVTSVVTPDLAARIERVRANMSRSAFVRAVLWEWMDRHFPEASPTPTLGGDMLRRVAALEALTVEVPPEDSTTKDPEHMP